MDRGLQQPAGLSHSLCEPGNPGAIQQDPFAFPSTTKGVAFPSTTKVSAKRVLKYYRVSWCRHKPDDKLSSRAP